MKLKRILALALVAVMMMSTCALAAPEGWTPDMGARGPQTPWYAEAVDYVMDKGLMVGVDADGNFAPEVELTTAQVLQTLYNREGKPDATENAETWYTDAVAWATKNGIVASFESNTAATRGDTLSMMAAYCGLKGLDDAGLMVGNESGDMMLDKSLTRAEYAQILTRLDPREPIFTETKVSYESEGRTVPAVVTMPVIADDAKAPAVVINHGHGGSKDENVGFIGVARDLAKAGIASIRMDFAGCGESKAPFTENTLSNMEADSNAGLAYLKANYPIDDARLGILGYSMGGRLALEIAAKKDNPYKAVALLSAAANPGAECIQGVLGLDTTIEDAKKLIAEKGSYDYTTQYGQNLSLSQEWFDDMMVDPLKDIKNYTGPMLVLHGDKDVVVNDEVNKMIVTAYPAATEIMVPDADHGYGFYSDQPDVTSKVENSITGFFLYGLNGSFTTSANIVSKYGNVTTSLPMDYLDAAGFEVGDILKVEITNQEPLTVPYGTGYSNVDQGKEIALADTDAGTLAIAINRGDFASTYGIAAKDENKVYTVDPAVTITVSMGEKGGYLDEMEIRELDSKRTNVREDYASDEVFANFRPIVMGNIAEGNLYRTSSPVNPELGRNTYADQLIEKYGVKTIVNLADCVNTVKEYEGFNDTYYAQQKYVCLNMGVDMYSAESIADLKNGLEFMVENPGPYAFHCTEGKDRAGYFAMLLEALMGAKTQEIITDYMLSFENYYHIANRTEQWMKIAESNIEKDIIKLAGVESTADLDGVDLAKCAEKYIIETIGLTQDQVNTLKTNLSTPIVKG